MKEPSTLADTIREKFAAGHLPREDHIKLWADCGGGRLCVACEQTILPTQTEHELEFADGRRIQMHLGCAGLYEAERRRRGWSDPARGEGWTTTANPPGDDRETRWEPSRGVPMSDALDTFLVEHRRCGVLVPHFVRLESAVERGSRHSGVRARGDKETVSLMCRGCGASLVLPMS
jgi:hypothetical protein